MTTADAERPDPQHPTHHMHGEIAPGLWVPMPPIADSTILGRWRQRRECRRRGGHWWHPTVDAFIDWYCCQCPAETDGMPRDGSAR